MCVAPVQFVISKVPSTIHSYRANHSPTPCSPKSSGNHGASSLQPELRGVRGAAAHPCTAFPVRLSRALSLASSGRTAKSRPPRLPGSQSDPRPPHTLALGRRPHVRVPAHGDPQPRVLASSSFQLRSPTSGFLG